MKLSGVEYFPRQRRKNKKLKFQIWTTSLLPVLVVLLIYYFSNSVQAPKKLKTGSIIIKKAEKEEKGKVSPTSTNAKISDIKVKEPEILENLDEIIINE